MPRTPIACVQTDFAEKHKSLVKAKNINAWLAKFYLHLEQIKVVGFNMSSRNNLAIQNCKYNQQNPLGFSAIHAMPSFGTHQNVFKSFPNAFFH